MSLSNKQHEIRREPIRDPEWVFPFGKHKDEKIGEVLDYDYHYVEWLMENLPDFDVHSDLLDSDEYAVWREDAKHNGGK